MTHCSVLYELPSWVKNICVGFGNTDPAVFAEIPVNPTLTITCLYTMRESHADQKNMQTPHRNCTSQAQC